MSNVGVSLQADEVLSLIHQKDKSFDDKLSAIVQLSTAELAATSAVSSSSRVAQHVRTSLLEWCIHHAASSEAKQLHIDAVAGLWASVAALCSDPHVRNQPGSACDAFVPGFPAAR